MLNQKLKGYFESGSFLSGTVPCDSTYLPMVKLRLDAIPQAVELVRGVELIFPYSTYDSRTKIKEPMKLGYGIRKVTSPAKNRSETVLDCRQRRWAERIGKKIFPTMRMRHMDQDTSTDTSTDRT